MSALAPKIFTALTSAQAVSAIVGTRVYPLLMPQGAALPSVTFTRVSSVPVVHLRGDSGLENARVQVDCWALSLSAASDLAAAVRAAMFAATTFSVGEMTGPSEEYEPDTKIYRVSMDFGVWNSPGAGGTADGGAWPAGAWPVGW